jgi:hypothetical protein
MTLDEVIHQHGAMAVFEAAAEGECGNLTPLRRLGLVVETIRDAEMVSSAVYETVNCSV